MHCYRTYAAITLIANTLEIMPEVGRKLPHSMLIDWISRHDIEPEDLLFVSPDEAKSILIRLVAQDRPGLPRAA